MKEDLLSITAVHPMKDHAVRAFLKKANAEWNVIENLIKGKKLVEIATGNKVFYLRELANIRKVPGL